MSIKIRTIELANPIVVAPMAGVTDESFRVMLRQFNPGLIYTEMVSDKAIVYRNQRTLDMMHIEPEEHPITLQVFGHDIDSMVEAAVYIDQNTDCDIIDVNMGCPVSKVVKNQAGSALMQDPEHIGKMMEALVKAVSKPVSAKIRAGWDQSSINAVEVARILEASGVELVAVHGRTRSQMYQGSADLEIIRAVKQAVSIPVLGNGDIDSVESAHHMMDYTGCDGVMIGRATLKNPWLIKQLVDDYNHQLSDRVVTMTDKLNWLDRHCRLSINHLGEDMAMRHMRSHALWLVSGLPKSAELKRLLTEMKSYGEFVRIIEEYKERVENYES